MNRLRNANANPAGSPPPSAAAAGEWPPRAFAGVFGAFLALSLLKFGNPPIMEKWTVPPADIWTFIFGSPWPIAWAYGLLVLVGLFGLAAARFRKDLPWWLVFLPLAWVAWTAAAATQSVDISLTKPTLMHLAACAVCFYLGLFCLGRLKRLGPFWIGLMSAFLLVIAIGWEQHFGGLDETRRYFYLYIYPQMKEVAPEYLKKMASNRIFSTLFYPNALAGALLLFLPPVLELLINARRRFTPGARAFMVASVCIGALGCLFWSGSKGGWLLMLVLGLALLLRLPFDKRFKTALIFLILAGGLTGFFWKYAAFFQKGATSVGARFDYWQAAIHTVAERPLCGTGAGTFYTAYQRVRRPGSEPTRLVHNDYLEQASDSGLPACAAYTVFILGALVLTRPRALTLSPSTPASPVPGLALSLSDFRLHPPQNGQTFAVWLGVFGFALQGLMEFNLYIPGLAWPAFALLGWLVGRRS